jgi:glucuronosyltransferase
MDELFIRHAAAPFDLIIVESFNTDCMLGVAHLLNIPVVALSSCSLMPWHYDRFALPDSPSFIPSQFVGFSEEMSFYERLVNWWIVKTIKAMYWFYNEDDKLLEAKFGKGIPDVRTLAAQTSLMLVNQHFSLSGAKILSPQVIEVGGLHIGESKPLPEVS